MVDLDAIRAKRAACADIPWSCPCVSGEQLDALVAELERLRSERSLLEQEARIRRRLCNRFADEVKQLRDADKATQAWWAGQWKAERALVVDYLSTLAVDSDTIDMERALLEAAQDIAKGEHRREEER